MGANGRLTSMRTGHNLFGFAVRRGLVVALALLPVGILVSAEPEALPEHAPSRSSVLEIALSLEGVPYRPGGSDGSGLDWSGLTYHVYQQLGLILPRTAAAQFAALPEATDPEPGDLVFFAIEGDHISHVGIYLGEGKFLHAPSSGGQVRIDLLAADYWNRRYRGVRRPALPEVAVAPALPTTAPSVADESNQPAGP